MKDNVLGAAALSAAGGEAGLGDERMSTQTAKSPSWKSDVCIAELKPLSKEQQFWCQGLRERLTHTEDTCNIQVKMIVLTVEL